MAGRSKYGLGQKCARFCAGLLFIASASYAGEVAAQAKSQNEVAASESDAESDAGAVAPPPEPRTKLNVIVAGNSPFVEQGSSGSLTGLSVEAFREAARIMDVDYELRSEHHVEDALHAVAQGMQIWP